MSTFYCRIEDKIDKEKSTGIFTLASCVVNDDILKLFLERASACIRTDALNDSAVNEMNLMYNLIARDNEMSYNVVKYIHI